MSVKYKDYYETLGVSRATPQKEIRKAYRELARKYHPDVNPGNKAAEEKFKDIQEAYAVLSDAEKRKRYDQLGSGWEAGADFTPPPGWRSTRVEFGDRANVEDVFGESGPFSDFFQSVFGGLGFETGRGGRTASRGTDVEAEIEMSLEDVHRGATPTVSLQTTGPCPDCGGRGTRRMSACQNCRGTGQVISRRRMTVNIPAGARDNSVLRLSGKGDRRSPDGPPGDLYLRIRIKPHPNLELVGTDDVQVEIPVTPWEAALGAPVTVPTIDGSVEMTIPRGTQSGSRLRLRGQGLRKRDGSRGDQFVKVRIALPGSLTPEEERLFQELARLSRFNPRA